MMRSAKRMNCQRLRVPQANGFTTLELTVSLVSATVLMIGLGSAVAISGRALSISPQESSTLPIPGTGLSLLREDLSEATGLTTASATAIEIALPDRDGDDVDEVVEYQFSDNQITRTENNGLPRVIESDVLEMEMGIGSARADANASPFANQTGCVTLHAHSQAAMHSSATQISIDLPAGTRPGELVLIAVAMDRDRSNSVSMPSAGWNQVATTGVFDSVSMSVWSRVIDGTESPTQTIQWTGSAVALAWAIRMSGTTQNPIHATNTKSGYRHWYYDYWGIRVPEVYASSYQATVLQFIAVDDWQFYTTSPRLIGYACELSNRTPSGSSNPDLQIACCFKNMSGHGASDNNNYLRFVRSGNYSMIAVAIEADFDPSGGAP